MPQPSPDLHLTYLQAALRLLAKGDRDGANEAAKQLAAELPVHRKRPTISARVCAKVFRRDGFNCRYCGGNVVPSAILNAAAIVWPDAIPNHPNWRTDATHPIFVAHSAMVDHIEPHAHGGSGTEISNLATACTPCNMQKSEFTLERLGWTLLEPVIDDWDGLTNFYPTLWQVAAPLMPPSQRNYHATWMKVLAPAPV